MLMIALEPDCSQGEESERENTLGHAVVKVSTVRFELGTTPPTISTHLLVRIMHDVNMQPIKN